MVLFWCATIIFKGLWKNLQGTDNWFDRFDRFDRFRINKEVDFNLNDDYF